ncbi:hypothetical protein [Modicisalibacter xianhensis]|uniref:hypothetical protein n=1 Tax=Modicisalibacter xianhensis TaxID=442341 RepID=UPI001063E6A4|nr:hypothetical protein [Halomonas xianhensis]
MSEVSSSRASIVKRYDEALKAAYDRYLQDMKLAGRNSLGQMEQLAMIDGSLEEEMKRASSRLGAAVGAASKRATREAIFTALELARGNGLDITPTVALHVAERVMGRGVSMRAATARFGTPGRTAADKSATSAVDLVELEQQIRNELKTLNRLLNESREEHRLEWTRSPERNAIIEQWRAAVRKGSVAMVSPEEWQRLEGM